MPGKREDIWTAKVQDDESGWWFVESTIGAPHGIAYDLPERTARRIVREHNLHPQLVDTLKLARRTLMGTRPLDGIGTTHIRDLIAEAEEEEE